MTTFNIGTQNAANVQNVSGNLVIEGGIHASASWRSTQLLSEIEHARAAAAELPLSPPARSSVDAAFAAAAADTADPNSDKGRIADHLATATRTLKEAGALATAGTEIVVPLRRAAALLGPVGAAILALL
jgi:hypothetical protein